MVTITGRQITAYKAIDYLLMVSVQYRAHNFESTKANFTVDVSEKWKGYNFDIVCSLRLI